MHGRAPLVHLRERAGGRVDDGDRRARLVGDADEVVEDPFEREVFDDAVAGAPAGEAGRDDRRLEALERARDVDPLAAGAGEPRARPMPVTELEVRDGQRPVDCRIEGDGDDQPE